MLPFCGQSASSRKMLTAAFELSGTWIFTKCPCLTTDFSPPFGNSKGSLGILMCMCYSQFNSGKSCKLNRYGTEHMPCGEFCIQPTWDKPNLLEHCPYRSCCSYADFAGVRKLLGTNIQAGYAVPRLHHSGAHFSDTLPMEFDPVVVLAKGLCSPRT